MDVNITNTWQFYLIGYIILVVLFNQFYKLAVRHAKRDGAATVLLQTIGGLSILVLTPLFAIKFPTDWKVYALLALACIFYALNDRIQTTVRKNLDVSVYTILNRLSSVFLIIFGLTIFKEPIVAGKIIGAILILLANIILRFSRKKIVFNKYIAFAALSNLALAIALSIDVNISSDFNLPIYIMFTLILPAAMVKLTEKIPFKDIRTEFSSADKKYYFITGILWGLLIVFMIRAYQLSSFSLITPLAATSVLINVLIATLFFGEKQDILKKIIAALISVVGVYFTVLK
ncbi:MAG: EamA family transporter [Ignavibacteriaceae bacterium]|jgi:drug/metabolite transporter (DMT)-like permease|nr:EamA family transporter [Ignavibacteriaceae bacterium]